VHTLLKKDETAKMLGIPENTLSYWVTIGYGPRSAKIGRHRVWREAECIAWVDAQFAAASAI
jgi:predicted DNA-binding transcriptional regulator AlpA